MLNLKGQHKKQGKPSLVEIVEEGKDNRISLEIYNKWGT